MSSEAFTKWISLIFITSKNKEVILNASIIKYKELINLKYLQPSLLYFLYIRDSLENNICLPFILRWYLILWI